MFCGVNAGTIRENRRHGRAIFYQKKKALVSRLAARIIHSSKATGLQYDQQPSHQYNLGTSACSFSRKELRLAQHKPCTDSQETKSNRTSQRRHRGHFASELVNTDVRIKGRTEVHMRAPVEIMSRLRRRVYWGDQPHLCRFIRHNPKVPGPAGKS